MIFTGRAKPTMTDLLNSLKAEAFTITLCSYVYNDGELADGLLASVESWTRQPDQIILVDDASNPPYVPKLPAFLKERTTLIRLPENGGPALAKSTGMNAVKTDFILSMDCDMRLSPSWLQNSLADAAQAEVGIVGVSVLCEAGEDLVSQYMNLFGHQMLADGEADFLSGNVWLMRRKVWEGVGGFGTYSKRTHEDHYYCQAVKAKGFKLLSRAARPGRQVRNLSRLAVLKRFSAWAPKTTATLRDNPGETGVQALGYVAFLGCFERIEYLLEQRKNAAFLYLELLLFAHTIFNIFKDSAQLNGAKSVEQWPNWLKFEAQSFWGEVLGLFSASPLAFKVLVNDLKSLGHNPPEVIVAQQQNAAENCFWAELFSTFSALKQAGGMLEQMEKAGLPQLLREEAQVFRNYSFYTDL